MTRSRKDVICGILVAIGSAVFMSQAFSSKDALVAEGIHPMDYPRVLIGVLFFLGVLIAVKPSASACAAKDKIPIISRRTVAMSAVLTFFAAMLDLVGFAASAFVCSSLCAAIMGWRRLLFLAGVNAVGCFCIWALFTYGLKIPLPPGTIW